MKIISKTEGSKRTSKQKAEIEFPKIAKNAFLEGATYQARYEWVNRSSQYVLISNQEVQSEHNYLVQQLSALQEQLLRLNEPVTSRVVRPLRKLHQNHIRQNHEIEIENNNILIWKLKNELQQLLRQAGLNSKENVDVALLQTKQKITKTKQKIKEIKKKSRQIEGSFQSGYDIFEEIDKLEYQKKGIEVKKQKIQEKMTISLKNLNKLQMKLVEIDQQFIQAEMFLQDYYSTQKFESQEKQMESLQRQKLYQMEVTHKMVESLRSVKQQKCHQLLKTLQNQMVKLELLQKKFQNLQMKNLHQKKQIIELQDQLEVWQRVEQQQATNSESLETRNNSNIPSTR